MPLKRPARLAKGDPARRPSQPRAPLMLLENASQAFNPTGCWDFNCLFFLFVGHSKTNFAKNRLL